MALCWGARIGRSDQSVEWGVERLVEVALADYLENTVRQTSKDVRRERRGRGRLRRFCFASDTSHGEALVSNGLSSMRSPDLASARSSGQFNLDMPDVRN